MCPRCGSNDVGFLATRRIWECKKKHAKKQFSVKVNTIFEDSPISLDKWLVAVWIIANCKNGVSSYEIHRAIGVTQKSAWFMMHRIRLALKIGSFHKLGGGPENEVEVDETFVGGKAAANVASCRISEKSGMRIVAREERDYVSGRLPTEIWEITADEWNARNKPQP